jgi:hypothetical protein
VNPRETRDLRAPTEPGNLELPACVTSNVLYALAKVMDKLYAYHRASGGTDRDFPCLKVVEVGHDERIYATIVSGNQMFKMQLVAGAWIFV